MPSRGTVRLWERENREGFAARYQTARELGCFILADHLLDIADNSRAEWILRRKPDGTTEVVFNHANIRRAQLRFNARNWLLSRMLPRIFADRPDPSATRETGSELAALMQAKQPVG